MTLRIDLIYGNGEFRGRIGVFIKSLLNNLAVDDDISIKLIRIDSLISSSLYRTGFEIFGRPLIKL